MIPLSIRVFRQLSTFNSLNVLLLLSLFLPMSLYANELDTHETKVQALEWSDLIPKNEQLAYAQQATQFSQSSIDHNSDDAPQQNLFGKPRQDLDGQRIKIPGFVIPLEGDDELVTEFLLVPFMGACIHVPPPPPNQIIYVKFKDGIAVNKLWEVITVEGVLNVASTSIDLAESSYLLEGIGSEPYIP